MFFDEFQNFLKINPSIIHDLQKFWDRYEEEKRFFVILSGSYIGMMRKVFLLRKSPLYGRADLYINLKPLRPSRKRCAIKTILNTPTPLVLVVKWTGGITGICSQSSLFH
ncbi:hypothetical protein DRN39_02125 [Thermococci archaeon]|nr:MAG: hypothetical protein DRN39_02125 [Thermococci archaeon]